MLLPPIDVVVAVDVDTIDVAVAVDVETAFTTNGLASFSFFHHGIDGDTNGWRRLERRGDIFDAGILADFSILPSGFRPRLVFDDCGACLECEGM